LDFTAFGAAAFDFVAMTINSNTSKRSKRGAAGLCDLTRTAKAGRCCGDDAFAMQQSFLRLDEPMPRLLCGPKETSLRTVPRADRVKLSFGSVGQTKMHPALCRSLRMARVRRSHERPQTLAIRRVSLAFYARPFDPPTQQTQHRDPGQTHNPHGQQATPLLQSSRLFRVFLHHNTLFTEFEARNNL
jgi:hypothetical protein